MFITATVRHQLGDDLNALLDALQDAWSRTWRFRRRPEWYGGQIRAVEVTHGAHGWHPHIHAAVFVRQGYAVDAELRALGTRWVQSLERHGFTASVRSSGSPGWDVRTSYDTAGLSDYLVKVQGGWGVGLELARTDLKRKGVTPFDLLQRAVNGDQRAARLWHVYERATKGRRRIVASPGLVNMVTDEEAAVAELNEPATLVVYVPAADWHHLLHSRQAARFLTACAELARDHRAVWPFPRSWILRHSPCSPIAA